MAPPAITPYVTALLTKYLIYPNIPEARSEVNKGTRYRRTTALDLRSKICSRRISEDFGKTFIRLREDFQKTSLDVFSSKKTSRETSIEVFRRKISIEKSSLKKSDIVNFKSIRGRLLATLRRLSKDFYKSLLREDFPKSLLQKVKFLTNFSQLQN
ncbi:hypothetical protein YC2023_106452 [Brassica napus]